MPNLASQEASKFKKPEKVEEKIPEQEKKEEKKEETIPEKKPEPEVVENLSEEGLDQSLITMVMDNCKCARIDAVKALRKNKGDAVNAILELTQNT